MPTLLLIPAVITQIMVMDGQSAFLALEAVFPELAITKELALVLIYGLDHPIHLLAVSPFHFLASNPISPARA